MEYTAIVSLGTYRAVEIQARPLDRYINATAMCRATGRLWADYWRLGETQEFVIALESDMGIPISDLVVSVRGGDARQQGTWVHRRVAIHLAQWCSPEFAVWVSGRIEELMLTGRTEIVREHSESSLAQHIGERVATQMMGMQRAIIEKVDDVHTDVRGIKLDTREIKESTARLEKFAIRKRKLLSEKVKRRHNYVVLKCFQRKCPCCREMIIVDEDGKSLDVCEYDHWVNPNKAGPKETWPVCERCNGMLGEPGDLNKRNPHAFKFQSYQFSLSTEKFTDDYDPAQPSLFKS